MITHEHIAAVHSTEEDGRLVTLSRYDSASRTVVERMAWLPVDGEPVGARVDDLGYIVTDDGRRF